RVRGVRPRGHLPRLGRGAAPARRRPAGALPRRLRGRRRRARLRAARRPRRPFALARELAARDPRGVPGRRAGRRGARRRHPRPRRRGRPALRALLRRRARLAPRGAPRRSRAPRGAARRTARGEADRAGRRGVGGDLRRAARGGGRRGSARVSAPEVSVLLLTLDAMPGLPELLRRLGEQRIGARTELVAIDSGSRDGSAELLAARADRLIRIPRERFDHGGTRNLGVEACPGGRVAPPVPRAPPAAPDWLAELLAPLREARVARAFSRQVPAPGASALARAQLAGWVAAGTAPRRVRLSPQDFAALAPLERLRACAFDNVSSS